MTSWEPCFTLSLHFSWPWPLLTAPDTGSREGGTSRCSQEVPPAQGVTKDRAPAPSLSFPLAGGEDGPCQHQAVSGARPPCPHSAGRAPDEQRLPGAGQGGGRGWQPVGALTPSPAWLPQSPSRVPPPRHLLQPSCPHPEPPRRAVPRPQQPEEPSRWSASDTGGRLQREGGPGPARAQGLGPARDPSSATELLLLGPTGVRNNPFPSHPPAAGRCDARELRPRGEGAAARGVLPPTLPSFPPPDPTNDPLRPEQDQTQAKLSTEAGPGVSTATQTFCPRQNHAVTCVGTPGTRAQHRAAAGGGCVSAVGWGCCK